MSRCFEKMMEDLSSVSGYTYDFLVEKYNEVMDEDDDIEYFVGVTLERDW